MQIPLPRGISAQQAAEAAQYPSSWGAPSACLHGVTTLFPCMRKVTCPLCPQGGDMKGSTSLQAASCQGQAGSTTPPTGTNVHLGLLPASAPLVGTAHVCHVPPALQMSSSPFRAIPDASWGWVSVHQLPQNSICPASAEASARWCSTYKADVLMLQWDIKPMRCRKTNSESSSELVAQLWFCS